MTRRLQGQRMRPRPGTVIIGVLVIDTLVSLAAYHFTSEMEAEHIATRNGGDHIKAEQAARSGIEALVAVLEQPRSRREEIQKLIGIDVEIWPGSMREESTSTFRIELSSLDESAKLNLHTLLLWEQNTPDAGINALLNLPGMDSETAKSILDWIDPDTQPRLPNGELHARNHIPPCIEELAALGGDSRIGQGSKTWLDYLTVVSAERNETFDGNERIHLNDPDLPKIHGLVSAEISKDLADFIVRFRQYGYEGNASASGNASDASEVDFSLPARYSFTSLGELVGSSVTVPANSGTEQVLVPSPVKLNGSYSIPIDHIFDLLTVNRGHRLVGRVNIQTAPVEVIAAIPGVGQADARQIIQARGFSDPIQAYGKKFRHPIGILATSGIDPIIISKILDQVTVRADVVKARVNGRNEGRVPEFSCEIMVDLSDRKPNLISMSPIGS